MINIGNESVLNEIENIFSNENNSNINDKFDLQQIIFDIFKIKLGNKLTESDIKIIEKKLNLKCGPQFNHFLTNYGYVLLYGYEFGGRKEDLIEMTEDIRTSHEKYWEKSYRDPILDKCIVFSPVGNGDFYMVDENDSVYLQSHESPNQKEKDMSLNIKFNNFLVERIIESIKLVNLKKQYKRNILS